MCARVCVCARVCTQLMYTNVCTYVFVCACTDVYIHIIIRYYVYIPLQIDELHTARQKLSAEMADNSNGIKNMIVRAEDARLMKNM